MHYAYRTPQVRQYKTKLSTRRKKEKKYIE